MYVSERVIIMMLWKEYKLNKVVNEITKRVRSCEMVSDQWIIGSGKKSNTGVGEFERVKGKHKNWCKRVFETGIKDYYSYW